MGGGPQGAGAGPAVLDLAALNALFQHLHEAVLVASPDGGRILLCNPAAEALFGYTAAEAAALTLDALVSSAPGRRIIADGAAADDDAAGAALPVPLLLPGRRRSGAPLDLELSLSRLDAVADGPPLLVAIIRDVTHWRRTEAQHARLVEHARELQSVAAELASTRETAALLNGLVRRTAAVFEADACAVWLFDQSGTLSLDATYGFSAEMQVLMAASRPRELAVLSDDAFRAFRPSFVPDLPALVRLTRPDTAALLQKDGIVSSLRLPLFAPGGEAAGWLALYHRASRVYGDDEIRLAQAFGDQIAVALSNTRLAEQERAARAEATRRLERLATLARITDQLLAATEPAQVLQVVVEAAVRLCAARAAFVALVDPTGHHLEIAATHGGWQGWFDAFGTPVLDPVYLAASPTGRALATGAAVLIADYTARPLVREVQVRSAEAGVRTAIVAPLRSGDERIGVLWVANDTAGSLTDEDSALIQALAGQAALALVQARLVEESHTLQTVAAELASTRDTRTLLEAIVQRTLSVMAADACAVWLLDTATGKLRTGAARGLSATFLAAVEAPDRPDMSVAFDRLRHTGKPWYSRDAVGDLAAASPTLAAAVAGEGIISSLRLPLFEPGGQIGGMLSLYHRRERAYSDAAIRLAQAFTDQIAVTLHNARLAEQEQAARELASRQLSRLTTLSTITHALLAATDLERMLQVVAESGWRLCDARGAMVALVDGSRRTLVPEAYVGPLESMYDAMRGGVELTDHYLTVSLTGRAIMQQQTMVVEDYATWPPSPYRDHFLTNGVRAFIVTPLLVGGEAIGVLNVHDTRPRPFAPDDVALVETLADHAALAIEHTRLVRRGQEAAVLEERARLARDLHDSVTQIVFSVGMLTRAAVTQHARAMPSLAATLERISGLSQQALAEMRALLFELRPGAVVEEGLAAALERLVEAVKLRTDTPISLTAVTVPRLPAEVETAVFRIVQEALANATKHARAKQVAITLAPEAGGLRISVEDDGAGFDPAAQPSGDGRGGGMGLRSMRERATAAGLALTVRSAPGAGAHITVTAPRALGTPE